MIPVNFDYARPSSVYEARALLTEYPREAIVLAGGQSLLTELKLRRREAGLVVDLAGIAGLANIHARADGAHFGAMARQTMIVDRVGASFPLLERQSGT